MLLNVKHLAWAMVLALAIVMADVSPVRADASLILVGGNTIYGNQLPLNNFGVAGTIQGLAAGYYNFALTRTAHHFTTSNLQLSVGAIMWSNFGSQHTAFIDNVPTAFGISGIIPYGPECGEYETVKLDIYNNIGQQVISNTLTITNLMDPTHQAPSPNFNINGNGAVPPSAIVINNDLIPNNITLNYTGIGTVARYRLYLTNTSAIGVPIPGGAGSDASWHNGPVPTIINVRSLAGGSFGLNQLKTHPGYYLITMETQGSGCEIINMSPPHKVLIKTVNIYDPRRHPRR